MRIQVIKAGEPVPAPGHPARWARSGLLARALAARGHEVEWVVSTFDHGSKTQVYSTDTTVDVAPQIRLIAFHAPPYAGHRSLARLQHHRILTEKLVKHLAQGPRPDLIVAALPVPEMAAAAVRAGKARGIPVVVDCRDQWPDIFLEGRGILTPLLKLVTAPMDWATRAACTGATAITGHTERFVEWGVAKAGRSRRAADRAFPLGYSADPPVPGDLAAAESELDALGIGHQRDRVRALFVGTLSQHFDLSPLIAGARRAAASGAPVELVICGDGDRRGAWESEAAGVPGIHWLGWRTAPFIWALLRRADLGLAPYLPSPSFVQSVPNKFFEYLSAGLPIASTLPGESEPLLTVDGAGWRVDGTAEGWQRMFDTLSARRPILEEGGRRAEALFTERFRADEVYGAFAAHLEGIVAASGSGR
jgi:glycosyltransferase involved in cell wall biosynthesis